MRRSLAIDGAMLGLVLWMWPGKLFRDSADLSVTAEPVTVGQIAAPIVAAGMVRPAQTVSVGGSTEGPVRSIEVDTHAFVRAGDVLATLDSDRSRATLSAAQISLAQAREELRNHQAALEDLERQRSTAEQLRSEAIVAPVATAAVDAQVVQAQAEVLGCEERVASADAAVARAAAEVQQTIISSPVDGLVLSIAPSAPLFRIAVELTHVEIEAAITDDDAGALQPGDMVTVSNQERALAGTVLAIEHNPGSPTATTALIDVPAALSDLAPGTAVVVAADGARRPGVVRIPNAALSFHPRPGLLDAIGEARVPTVTTLGLPNGPLARVWTYDGSEFTAIQVRIGFANARWTELIDGPLHAGDMLITSASMPGPSR